MAQESDVTFSQDSNVTKLPAPDQYFTHLHLHTEYSLLDGAISLQKLVDFGKEQNLKALAITDHGNIFGAVKFFELCKKANIKPILGIEAYLTEDVAIKDAQEKYYHLILLVQNDIGYKNLCKLISFSFTQGFYFKPRIDYAILEKHSEGLIVTTACLGGHIPKLLMRDDNQAVQKRIEWFMRVFPGRFYLEVQPEDQKEQITLNQKLYELAKQYTIPLLAAGDCHYATQDDHEAHEIMLSLQTHNKLDDPNRYTFGDCRVYMRTQQEMLDIFKDHPEAVWNSGKIADSCTFDFKTGTLFFPKFEIPQEHTSDSYFKYLCQQGLDSLFDQQRISLDQKNLYQERLNLETDLIIQMGFVGYFLVVSDFIRWARRNDIPVGPGRGSAAGSLVSWALEITNIDPLKYNLLFERFLNPERITMPDIDIDFCIEGRETVINYVKDKYGHDKVCQIITFGTMLAKGVIKDVGRVLGLPFEDLNYITSLIPDQLRITLKEALEQEPRLNELIHNNPKVAKVFDIGFRLEGLTRHASKHAAGIVISPEPIDEVLPVYIPAKSNELVTQYAMTELESIGFLKIDFLGLKNLTLIKRVTQLIQQQHGLLINIDMLPLDDTKTFELICAGKTSGVFQLESDGLKEVLRKLQPTCFEDIIAVNALYRPGPLGSGMVDDFIERKHGRQKIRYVFNELEPILQETYGVIVYQEQVIKIASAIGGYSLGEADILRRAMGKKKVEVMAEQREIFVTKSREQQFDSKKAGDLFDLMAYFAGYGFNKSHSAAYALIAYQTAYLKANYPAEFMASLISLESDNAEKMAFYLQEARDMLLDILPPDINQSQIEFSVKNNKIRFGLRGIKNVGLASLQNIIVERQKKSFKDLFDFCKRIDLRTSNKRVIENLIYAGAFDTLPGNRAQHINELMQVMDQAVAKKKAEITGQMGLFDVIKDPNNADNYLYNFQPLADFSDREKLEKEKEVIGFYLSSHPLETYRTQLKRFNLLSFAQILEKYSSFKDSEEPVVLACGLLKSKREITTKKGDRMAFVQLEDTSGTAEIIVFPRTYKASSNWLDTHTIFVVKGAFDASSTLHTKIKANDLIPLELVFQEWPSIEKISLILPDYNQESPESLESFNKLLKILQEKCVTGKIPLHITFNENNKTLTLIAQEKIALDEETVTYLEEQKITITCTL